ncbi:MAG: prepilin-type N-terminal cleavage/methylation domain-containing protein [Planctomycetes bacterium]|nr:prepilin-type N-terminal cleavage/methylation domain-containing protein [Planctomycetota bacterium]
MNTATNSSARRGFSLVEVLIALTITASLLTAMLVALDASFKGYKYTTDQASNNVVARIVMQRITAMVRTGTEFGPYPDDVLDATQNPLSSTFIEFESARNDAAGTMTIVRLERRDATATVNGPFELWYVQKNYTSGTLTRTESHPLISNLQNVTFTMEYDVGPRLRKATIDMVVNPNGLQITSVQSAMGAGNLRMVTSVVPRRLD